MNTPNEKSIEHKFGVAVLTYLGGLLVTLIVGCIVGFGIAWLSIWINGVIDELIVIVCVAFPAGIVRVITRRANIMTGLIGASGAFIAIFAFYATLDYMGLTWSDSDSIWDNFWIYGIMAIVVGVIVGMIKGKDT